MFLMYFSEQPYSVYPIEAAEEAGVTTLVFPNSNFDPQQGSDLYNRYLDEAIYSEEVGFDGIMLNEHHNAPFCMQAATNIEAAILARQTQKAKIVLLGNVLPISDNPLRLAEEIGMVDMISRGRLVSGFVRGGGVEQLANNANPSYNRERFEEGHDLIMKAWTTPGPFRWEGKHYHYRVVNPWVVPLQKPHPRVWIPGTASKETIIWAAQHRYPYIALATTVETTKEIWELYDQTAEEAGYTAGPEQHGYLVRCHVEDTDELAIDGAQQFLWQRGEFTGIGRPEWLAPPGYSSPEAVRVRLQNLAAARTVSLDEQIANNRIVAGSPSTVVERLRYLLGELRPGIVAFWGNDGRLNHERSMNCIRLFGQEVLPAIREIGQELELFSPYELNTPVSLAATTIESVA